MPSTLGKPVATTLVRGGAVSCTCIWPWLRGWPWSKAVSVTRARSVSGRMCSRGGVLVSTICTPASSACPVLIHGSQQQTRPTVNTRQSGKSLVCYMLIQ